MILLPAEGVYESYDLVPGVGPSLLAQNRSPDAPDGFDQPEWEAYERGAPPPQDGGSWVWEVPARVAPEVVTPNGPDGAYERHAVVRRLTTKGQWLLFPRGLKLAEAYARDANRALGIKM
jgi:hypothetical protein